MRLYKLLGIAILMVAPTLQAQSRAEIIAQANKLKAHKADSVRRANTGRVPTPPVIVKNEQKPSGNGIDSGMNDSAIKAGGEKTVEQPARQRVYSDKPLPDQNIFKGGKSGTDSPPVVEPPKPSPTSHVSTSASAPSDSGKKKPVIKKRIPTGVAIVKNIGRDVTPEEFADACEKNDMKVLNVNCDVYAQYLHDLDPVVFKDVEDRTDLAAFVRHNVVMVDCFKGGAASKEPISTARGLRRPNGNVVMDHSHTWARYLYKGAQCGYSNNDGKLLFVASCWNLIEEEMSVAHLSAPVAPPAPPPPPAQAAPAPPVWTPSTVAPPTKEPALPAPMIEVDRGMSGWTKFAIGAVTAGVAGAVYCGPVRKTPCSWVFKSPDRDVTQIVNVNQNFLSFRF